MTFWSLFYILAPKFLMMNFNFETGATLKFGNAKLLCSYNNNTQNTAISDIDGIDFKEFYQSNIYPIHLWIAPFLLGSLITLFSSTGSFKYYSGIFILFIALIFFIIDMFSLMLATYWSQKIVEKVFAEKYYQVEIKAKNNWSFIFHTNIDELETVEELKQYIEDFIINNK